jgi:glycerophosphoryl diester phosphodiesterase
MPVILTPAGGICHAFGMDPHVVAHRGASHELAEHTLAAYLRALDAGADGLECDVRLTADGHLVCFHDRDLRRTGQSRGLLSTMELSELDHLEFASWKNPWSDLDDEAPDPEAGLDRVLTLRRLLETVADCGRRVELAIETKHPTRFSGLVEKRLVEELRHFGWHRGDTPVRVMSFSWTALQRMERLAPDVPLVMLIDKARHWPLVRAALGEGWILGPGIEQLMKHPSFGARLVATGREIHVWTVNTAEELELCRSLGVTAVISDRPAYLLEKLGR